MNIVFHKKFKKAFQKQPAKVRKRFKDQLEVFYQDPYDPTLNNHALTDSLKPHRSINITSDIRAWYEVVGDDIVFLKIGDHSELYG